MPQQLEPDTLIVSAAKYLAEGGDHALAAAVLACTVADLRYGQSESFGGRERHPVTIELRGPRVACDLLGGDSYPEPGSTQRLARDTFAALLPHDCWLDVLVVRIELVPADPPLRADLLELMHGKTVHNQAVSARQSIIWQGLRFCSETERRVARALDAAGVLFLPNCMARLNGRGRDERVLREPDFLICRSGRWGILEVDGEAFHPSAAQDHDRDALFYHSGVKCIRHYSATRCYEDAPGVVEDFLIQLDKMYR
jgi:hypothetical protein